MNTHTQWTAAAGQQVRLALRQARLLQPFYRRNQMFFRFIDNHQKWLLLHLVIESSSNTAGSAWKGVAANWMAERAATLDIASRNTTLAFFGQLAAYGYLQRQSCPADGRIRLLVPAETLLSILSEWTTCLVGTVLPAHPGGCGAITRLHSAVASELATSPAYRQPIGDVGFVQATRGGWLMMSDILGRIEPGDSESQRMTVRDFSVSNCARQHGLSKTTLYRLLRRSADAGNVGWTRQCGEPVLWVDRDYLARFCAWNGLLLDAVTRGIEASGGTGQPIPLVTVETHPRGKGGISSPATCLV